MRKHRWNVKKQLSSNESKNTDFEPHGHCKVCGKIIVDEDEYIKVSEPWENYLICDKCYYNIRDTCLSNSKSKSRAKRENGYF